jgi:hypothetical protein
MLGDRSSGAARLFNSLRPLAAARCRQKILPDAGFVVCVPGRRAPQYSSQTVSCVACGPPAGTGLSNRPFLRHLEGVGAGAYVFWNLFLKRLSTIRRHGQFLGPRVLNLIKGTTVCVWRHASNKSLYMKKLQA